MKLFVLYFVALIALAVTQKVCEDENCSNESSEDTINIPEVQQSLVVQNQFPQLDLQSVSTVAIPQTVSTRRIVVPPITNTQVIPVEREESVTCPLGFFRYGNVCNAANTNRCPQGYTFIGDRCVIKVANCPENFEKNGFGNCIQRQICPHNHIWENGRCRSVTECPSGWKWNGHRCEVMVIQCQPGSVLHGNECIVETSTCPIGTNQIGNLCVAPSPECPVNYEMKANGFCSRITVRCRSGSTLINGECRITETECPIGTYREGNVCVKIETIRQMTCAPGYYLNGDRCFKIALAKQTLVCPPGTYKKGEVCVAISMIGVLSTPEIVCPPGSYKIGQDCYQNAPPPPPEIVCPPGFYKSGNRCIEIAERPAPRVELADCPPGTYRVGEICYQDAPAVVQRQVVQRPVEYVQRPVQYVQRPVEILEQPVQVVQQPIYRPVVVETAPRAVPQEVRVYNAQPQCPQTYTMNNNQCQRCPENYDLCGSKCVNQSVGCDKTNYPNINVNTHTGEGHAPGREINIVNTVGPFNNTITNINNITIPVTLNNKNENNISIHTDHKCPDGSIRTVVEKNHETINGCVNTEPIRETTVEVRAERPQKCCEVVTPRRCQSHQSQWQCAHRRYKYCGQFCTSNRVFLRPPATTYNNQVLTIAPMQIPAPTQYQAVRYQGYNDGGHSSIDCSGCINGSFNCSPQCYTYPCSNGGCHYLNQEDFCDQVGGDVCE